VTCLTARYMDNFKHILFVTFSVHCDVTRSEYHGLITGEIYNNCRGTQRSSKYLSYLKDTHSLPSILLTYDQTLLTYILNYLVT